MEENEFIRKIFFKTFKPTKHEKIKKYFPKNIFFHTKHTLQVKLNLLWSNFEITLKLGLASISSFSGYVNISRQWNSIKEEKIFSFSKPTHLLRQYLPWSSGRNYNSPIYINHSSLGVNLNIDLLVKNLLLTFKLSKQELYVSVEAPSWVLIWK